MDDKTRSATESFQKLLTILKRLRAPDGCPWDRKQTLKSMAPRILEEAFEVADAVDSGQATKISEELGDLSMNVFLTCLIAEEEGLFDTEEALKKIAAKLIGRHPHVFGDSGPMEEERFLRVWEDLKRRERREKREDTSLLAGVPKAMPALLRGLRMVEKLKRANAKLPLFRERKQGIDEEPEDKVGEALLDLLLLSASLKVDAETALRRKLNSLEEKFRRVESSLGYRLSEAEADEIDSLWHD